jgi:hypothetical protein
MDKFTEHQRKAGAASNRNLTQAQRDARSANGKKAILKAREALAQKRANKSQIPLDTNTPVY